MSLNSLAILNRLVTTLTFNTPVAAEIGTKLKLNCNPSDYSSHCIITDQERNAPAFSGDAFWRLLL